MINVKCKMLLGYPRFPVHLIKQYSSSHNQLVDYSQAFDEVVADYKTLLCNQILPTVLHHAMLVSKWARSLHATGNSMAQKIILFLSYLIANAHYFINTW